MSLESNFELSAMLPSAMLRFSNRFKVAAVKQSKTISPLLTSVSISDQFDRFKILLGLTGVSYSSGLQAMWNVDRVWSKKKRTI